MTSVGEVGKMASVELYEPTNVLKPVSSDIWVVDGPVIKLQFAGLRMPFTTRMTVIRLANGEILLHSPVAYSTELAASVTALGPITNLVAPNSLHYWWIPDWKASLPEARVFAVPGLARRARREVPVDAVLGNRSPWPDEIDVLMTSGDAFCEAVLFHRSSRTLILTDLIENFEPGRMHGWLFRRLIKISGASDPDGKAPIDMQLSFLRHRRALRAAVEQMVAWGPDRIILAHGRWYEGNGVAELRRAFRWVL